jgi:hypothetical protein
MKETSQMCTRVGAKTRWWFRDPAIWAWLAVGVIALVPLVH